MGVSTSPLAYADIKKLLDQALEAPTGIIVTLPTKGAATNMKQRMYSFRNLNRRESTVMYSKDDLGYNTSIYDILSFVQVEKTLNVMNKSMLEFEVKEV